MSFSENWQEKSDEELVNLALDNQESFLYIMKRYQDKLMRFVRRISAVSLEEAEDLLQEVFIKVYKNLNNFDPELKFSSWIYRITRNEVISYHRKVKARPKQVNPATNDQGEEIDFIHNLADELDMETEINARLDQKIIHQTIKQLPEKYREVLVLKFLEQKDYQEISDILKKPTGTVGTLINRAKKKFREELKRQNIQL